MQLPTALTFAQASQALVQLQAAVGQSAPGQSFVVDASALTEFDTSAIAVLLEARRLAQGRGVGFEVRQAPAKLGQLAALYGVEDLLSLQPPGA
jgi:phospholipid transport system transporter-binding protein